MNHPWELSPFSVFTEEGDPDYKKELKSYPEFTLYEHFRPGGPTSVQLSPEVEIPYRRAKFGLNTLEGSEERLTAVETLEALGKLGRLDPPPHGKDFKEEWSQLFVPLLDAIVELLGKPIAEALANDEARHREQALMNLATKFKTSMESLHRAHAPNIEHLSSARALLPPNQVILPIAVAQLCKYRKRPTKSALREILERMGYSYSRKDKWNDRFKKAGFERLPWE